METMSDQSEAESRTEVDSNDEDSTMEDVVTTPRTTRSAPSDSQDASEPSTRASTPTENRAESVPNDCDSLKPFEQDERADDVTMKDVCLREDGPAGTAEDFSNPKVVSWHSSTVIDPDSSPWKAGKTKEEPVDYVSNPRKPEGLLRFHDPEAPDLHSP